MARTRNLKPSFFTNEKLADLDPLARLLFQGLWLHADKEGRLEDRPRKLKAEILPYDECNIGDLLAALNDAGFIERYEVGGVAYIALPTFRKHQNPHPKESDSEIPAPPSRVKALTSRGKKRQAANESASVPAGPVQEMPSPNTPHANTPSPSIPSARRKPEVAIPDGFVVTEKMRDWAARKVPSVDVDFETENFRDHAIGHDRRASDWEATWRTWMRKSVDFKRQAGNGQRGNGETHKQPSPVGRAYAGDFNPEDYRNPAQPVIGTPRRQL